MSEVLRERYERAAALLPARLPALMRNRRVEPVWTGDGDTFWYRRQTGGGEELVLVDPLTGTRRTAPDLAALGLEEPGPPGAPGVLHGPDGRGLLCRDDDLWLVDGADERRLTTDGEPSFAWGVLPSDSNVVVPFRRAGVVLPPVGTVHSPSGRHVLTVRVDERAVPLKHMVENVPPSGARPECHEWRVALESDPEPPPAACRVLDLDTGLGVDVDSSDGLAAQLVVYGSSEVTWSQDESRLYLLRHRVGAAQAALVEVDVRTGARRDAVVLEEAPLYEPNQYLYGLPLVRVLPESGEALLLSQRDGWGHLYRYDLRTGACLNRVSDGELVVRDLLHVDVDRREVTYLAGTASDGGNPYWRRLYRAGLDGGTQQLLTPEPCDHELAAPEPQFFRLVLGQGRPSPTSTSPSGRFFVDHMSTVSDPPVIVLRDAEDGGRVVVELEVTDVAPLLAAGYVPPTSFCVTADDGSTDLWGVLALPPEPLDPERVPVVEDVYAGFQMSYTPQAFLGGLGMSSRQGGLAAWNALGFAGVMLDGRGTPGRDRAFRQHTFRQCHTERGLADHVTALRALGQLHPQLDLSRVGAFGHSYGGYNAARLILQFPDAYRAAVSSSGVHDVRKSRHGAWDWHTGGQPDRSSREYLEIGNLHLAEALRGDLLLTCGEIDENATMDHTLALAKALMDAGKRFDLKVWPGVDHYRVGGYAYTAFWDHMVRALHGEQPPRDWSGLP